MIMIMTMTHVQVATVSGWGTLSSGGSQPSSLQEVEVTVSTNAQCSLAYGTYIGG